MDQKTEIRSYIECRIISFIVTYNSIINDIILSFMEVISFMVTYNSITNEIIPPFMVTCNSIRNEIILFHLWKLFHL